MFNDDEYDETPPALVPCHTCGRNFSEHAIQRHTKICQKVTSKKRKVFDSHSQRKVEDSTGGGSLSTMVSKKYSNPRMTNNRANQQQRSSPKEVALPKSNWKQKHEDFIRTVRAARQATTAVKQGKPLPPPPPAAINPDYIQCPHCQRRFNQSAAERHISFCAEQRKRLGANAKHQQASAAMKARTKYKPPALKTRSAPAPAGAQHPGRQQQRALNGTANPTHHGAVVGGGEKQRSGVAFSRPSPAQQQQRKPVDRSQQNGGNQRRLGPQSSQRRPKAEWDSSIEESPAQRTRTKTGLKPVNSGGSTRARKASPPPPTGVKQPAVRKIARAPRSQPYYADVKRRPSPGDEEGRIRDTPKYGSRDDDDSYHPSAYTTPNQPPDPAQRYGVKKPVRVSPAASYKHNNGASAGALRGNANVMRANYCQECGSKFPVVNAKFCCECGMRRFSLHD